MPIFTPYSGRNFVGGPHRVELRAFDGVPYQGREMEVEEGRPLFGSLMAEVDLPEDSAMLEAVVETQGDKPQFLLTVSR